MDTVDKKCIRCYSADNGFTKSRVSKNGFNALCKQCTRADSRRQYERRVGHPAQVQHHKSTYDRHGHVDSPEYYLWSGMKDRCLNPRNAAYARYGGRGITVCAEWVDSFPRFLADIGPRPSSDHTVERIDNNGNYEPNNVRWATAAEQSRNKRNNRMITFKGLTMCMSDWARHLGMPLGTISGELHKGYSVEHVLTPLPSFLRCEWCDARFRPSCKSQRFCSLGCGRCAATTRHRAKQKALRGVVTI